MVASKVIMFMLENIPSAPDIFFFSVPVYSRRDLCGYVRPHRSGVPKGLVPFQMSCQLHIK